MRLLPALVVLLALLAGCSEGEEPSAPVAAPSKTPQITAEEGRPAGPAVCRTAAMRTARASGDVFATCVTAALAKHRTVRLEGEQTEGEKVIGAVAGTLRFAPTHALEMTIFNGAATLLMIGDRAWMKDDKGWVVAGESSTRAQTAQTQATLWRASSTLKALRDFYSTTTWRPSGKVEDVNGIRLREYVGAPHGPGAAGVPTEIWLSRANLPVRMVSHAQSDDGDTTNTVTLTDFGQEFEYVKPRIRRDRKR